MKPVKQRMLELLFGSDLVFTRFILSASEMLWAILLWLPSRTFDRPTYTHLKHVYADENVWGAIFAISAIIQGYIVLKECYHNFWSVVFALFNASLWTFVVIAMLTAVPSPAAISAEIMMSFSALLIFVRSGLVTTNKGGFCEY